MRVGRVNLRVYILSLLVLLAAGAFSFACAHTDLGPMDPIIKTTPPDFGTRKTPVFKASVDSIGIHDVVIDFGEPVKDTTFKILARTGDGRDIPVTLLWPPIHLMVHVKGPFPFCQEISIIIRAGAETYAGAILNQDLELPVYIGSNPNDVDGSESCTADIVVSPLFNELDGVLLTGDMILERPYSDNIARQDIDTQDIFYIDYSVLYDFAGPIKRIPVPDLTAVNEGGQAGLAMLSLNEERNENNKLVAKHYTIDFWNIFDPVYEKPTTSILYDNATIEGKNLNELMYAGDINGDGEGDIILSEELITNGEEKIQYIYILKGPLANGRDLMLTDEADPSGVAIGEIEEAITAPFFLGDVDGDGKDDFGTIHNLFSNTLDPLLWDVFIYHGNEDTTTIFSALNPDFDVIEGVYERNIVGLTSFDGNGDGIDDVVISELEERYALNIPLNAKPHIGIFFGGESFKYDSMEDPDVELLANVFRETHLSVNNLGDVDGNGFDDLGILIEEEDVHTNLTATSKLYVVMGKQYWYERYMLNSYLLPAANLIIDTKGYGAVDIMQTAGDVDNDGYYDIVITTDDGVDKRVHIFFGSNGYQNMGWELTLNDADAIWTFSKR